MRKLGIGIIITLGVLLSLFLWLASGGSAKHAPQELITTDLPDSYETVSYTHLTLPTKA